MLKVLYFLAASKTTSPRCVVFFVCVVNASTKEWHGRIPTNAVLEVTAKQIYIDVGIFFCFFRDHKKNYAILGFSYVRKEKLDNGMRVL